ncbi:MAG: S8 family serine peptidase [Candidatus Eisenbacteria bacterium]|nr:S8 family serine peptidase [Candidatus Eisenbacteria bacterium]
MNRWILRTLPAVLLLVLVAVGALAQSSKLDPRARIALSQLRAGSPAGAVRAAGAAVDISGDLDVFVTGTVTRAQLESFGARVRTVVPGVMTAFLPVSAVDAIAALPEVTGIHGAAPVELELDSSVPATNASALRGAGPAFTGLNGAGVVVGDVDTGIDYKHGAFKDAAGLTRIVGLWDQTDAVGPNPGAYPYGSEWTPASINAGTAREKDTGGHGTHVMGIAAGDGSQTGGSVAAYTYTGMAPMADIVMVKSDLTTTHILDGVAYVFGVATALGRNSVCNLSLGSHYGPHDGTSPFEAGLSALTGAGRVIIKSAGNERGQSRHAEVQAAGAGTPMTFLVSGSANGRQLAFDGYYEATEAINLTVTTPNGTVIGPIALGAADSAYPGVTTTSGRVYVENGLSVTSTGAREVYVELTALNSGASPGSMNGTWTLTFIPVSLGPANGQVDLWRFYNSTSLAGNFVVGMSEQKLVSEPGNATDLITTAAWVSRRYWTDCGGRNVGYTGALNPGNLASFSSPGPTRDGRQKPDIAAPGTAIGSTRSFDISFTCGASATTYLFDNSNHVINQGTSMAAPHTTGATALLMQKYGAVTPAFVRTFLAGRAIVDGFTGATWNKDWGYGKLWLGDLVDPAVTVTAPDGGELYFMGSLANLTWNATDNVGVTTVDLLVSRDNGATFAAVASGVPNTGVHSWTIAGPPSLQCLLKVVAHDAAANTGSDVSDNVFMIVDPATPVLMSTLSAEPLAEGVAIHWQLNAPRMLREVALERAAGAQGPFARVQAVSSGAEGPVTVLDRTAQAGSTYWYRVSALEGAGRAVTLGPIRVTAGVPVTRFELGRAIPNPSRGAVRVDYALPRAAQVTLAVMDVQGREVARLVDGSRGAGRHQAAWNGETRSGRAPAGMYFLRLQAGEVRLSQRMVLSR